MNKSIALLLTSIIGFNLNAQNWLDISSSNISATLNDVYFLDDSTGWVVGTNGSVFFTKDKGVNWNQQTTTTTSHLYAVHFYDANNGWVTGQSVILHTNDGGLTWTEQFNGTTSRFIYVHFFDVQTGVVCGGKSLYYTNDGGTNWVRNATNIFYDLEKAHFVTADSGWAITARGELNFTTNKGISWSKIFQADASFTFKDMAILSNTNMLITTEKNGRAVILKTTDGTNWTEANNSFHANQGYNTLSFHNMNNGWICAKDSIFKTTDGGVNLIGSHLLKREVNGIQFTNPNHGYFVGDYGQIIYYGNQISPTFSISDTALVIISSLNDTSLNISSNTSWTVSSDQTWLTTSTSGGTGSRSITFYSTKNDMAMERVASVTFDIAGVASKTVLITQSGAAPTLTLSSSTLSVAATQGSIAQFNIISNAQWNILISQPWITLDKTSGIGDTTLTITANLNPNETTRTGDITVNVTGVPSQIISVTQEEGSSVNVHELEVQENLVLFPNPSTHLFSVENIPMKTLVKIYNTNGSLVFEESVNDKHFDISSLPKGMYVLTTENARKVFVKQ